MAGLAVESLNARHRPGLVRARLRLAHRCRNRSHGHVQVKWQLCDHLETELISGRRRRIVRQPNRFRLNKNVVCHRGHFLHAVAGRLSPCWHSLASCRLLHRPRIGLVHSSFAGSQRLALSVELADNLLLLDVAALPACRGPVVRLFPRPVL